MSTSNAIATVEPAHNSIELPNADAQFAGKVWEFIAGGGDLAKLDDAGKATYYRMRCEAAGLDPATFPFQLITLQGKLTLYATKTATDQLCHKRNISKQILDRQSADGVHIVTCRASLANGRFTDATGAVTVKGLAGDPLCNALMKAETKAKRRAVLALTGLGALDETELETIPGAQFAPLPRAVEQASSRQVEHEIATREQIADANEWRRRAVEAGYRTANGTEPKIIGEGEKLRNVQARADRWRAEAEKLEAEEMGEPDLDAEDFGPQTTEAPAPDPRGTRYKVPDYYPPRNCKSCSAPLAFIPLESGKEMPIDTRGENRGYSHFPVCPGADAHRKPRAPKASAVEGEAAYADAKPAPKMTKHLAHLWAVAGANGLKSEPRAERIDRANQVLLDHQIDPVESWNDLTSVGAQCLAGAIDAKLLTWGEQSLSLDGEAA